MSRLEPYDSSPHLYLFTSLTAGSSHIVTATSRIETILKANKIPFIGVDTATDENAKKLYQRRGAKRKLPLLVKDGFVIGDLKEIEEWNEYDELKEVIGPVPGAGGAPAPPKAIVTKPASIASTSTANTKTDAASDISAPSQSAEATLAMRALSTEAAQKATDKKTASLHSRSSLANEPRASVEAEPKKSLESAISGTSAIPVAQGPSGEIKQHRGSSISIPDEGAIKAVEESTAIPEAPEEESTGESKKDQTAEAQARAPSIRSSIDAPAKQDDAAKGKAGSVKEGNSGRLSTAAPSTASDAASVVQQEGPAAASSPSTQSQDPKAEADSGKSVVD